MGKNNESKIEKRLRDYGHLILFWMAIAILFYEAYAVTFSNKLELDLQLPIYFLAVAAYLKIK